MTKEVQIGGQVVDGQLVGGQIVKLRATGRLPIAYRLLFNRDLLRDMEELREQISAKSDADAATPEAAPDSADASGDNANDSADAATPEAAPDSADASGDNANDNAQTDNEILYSMDLDFMARLSYAMAKSADPSIPNNVDDWLDTLDSPNALYILTGHALELYNNGFQTTVEAKKNIPQQRAK